MDSEINLYGTPARSAIPCGLLGGDGRNGAIEEIEQISLVLHCARRPVFNAEVPSSGGHALRTGCDGGGWLSTDGRKQSYSGILCPPSGASKRCPKRRLDT